MNHLTSLLIVLAILGIIDSGYLIRKRLMKKPLVCPIGDNCNKVVGSKYNRIFLIKNDILGLVYYTLLIIAILYFLLVSEKILFLMQVVSGFALLITVFLFYIQAKILKEYCFYCNIANSINLLIFLLFLFL